MPFHFPCAMGEDERLLTAKGSLVHTLKMTQSLLVSFPIPFARETIDAVLHIITEAEVRTKVEHCYFVSLLPSQRTAVNAELCDKLKEHILRLHNQLIQPLVGKKVEEIPDDTLVALGDFTK